MQRLNASMNKERLVLDLFMLPLSTATLQGADCGHPHHFLMGPWGLFKIIKKDMWLLTAGLQQ